MAPPLSKSVVEAWKTGQSLGMPLSSFNCTIVKFASITISNFVSCHEPVAGQYIWLLGNLNNSH